jgi:hypothetical protein
VRHRSAAGIKKGNRISVVALCVCPCCRMSAAALDQRE